MNNEIIVSAVWELAINVFPRGLVRTEANIAEQKQRVFE
jgi:hypothetical protein